MKDACITLCIILKSSDFSSVLETIRGNLGKVKVGSEEEFAAKLGLTVESPCSYEDILLLKQKEGIDLETLVHSLVCTPGLGRLVSDIHPPCKFTLQQGLYDSKPPESQRVRVVYCHA